jgi:hypothetical protein
MAKRNYQNEFHPEAIREIRESIQWYRDRNELAADELRSLVQSAESLMAEVDFESRTHVAARTPDDRSNTLMMLAIAS